MKLSKARTLIDRFREVISDPLNLLINRVPDAGYVVDELLTLHNGNRIPPNCYYGDYGNIFVSNRGVHEPLEEFVFQEMLGSIKKESPTMLELGSYWAHYSMWFKKHFPNATNILVEPGDRRLEIGRNNFALNGYSGEFIQAFVSKDQFTLDGFLRERGDLKLDVLHADIQGYEVDLLTSGETFLKQHLADYIFISTHTQAKHTTVHNMLEAFGYRVEVSSDFNFHTTSCDGLVFASSPNIPRLFSTDFVPLGRLDICNSTPDKLLAYLVSIK